MSRLFVLVLAVLALPSVVKAVNITDYGGMVGQNATPPLNAAVAAARNSDHVVTFPQGIWPFDSAPDDLNNVKLVGTGMASTFLIKKFSDGGLLHWTGSGGGAESMSILAGAGTTGGSAIMITATNAQPLGYLVFKDLAIDGDHGPDLAPGLWSTAININGTTRTMAPIGVRSTSFVNVYVWNASAYAAYIGTGVAVSWTGGGTFGGDAPSGDVFISGVPNLEPSMLSSNINWDASVGGMLWICDAAGVNVRGVLSGLWVGCSGGDHVIIGPVFGPVTNYLLNVRIVSQK